MGSKGAVEIIFKGDDDIETRTEEYVERFETPMIAAQRGFIDAILDPEDTRARLCADLELLEGSERRVRATRYHGNIPL